VNKRRSLTPTTGTPNASGGNARAHALRRGGARQTVSDRVTFRGERGVHEGWALNVSRGGVRAILDRDTGKVELGEEYEVSVGSAGGGGGRKGRIVWLQEEPDGFVVGIEYLSPPDASGVSPTVSPDHVDVSRPPASPPLASPKATKKD
jgi:hypothetical protein